MGRPPTFEHAEALADELRGQLAGLRADAARRADDVQEIEKLLLASEKQAAQLANLYVATYQLHASLELDAVQTAICEIAVNLLGAAQYVLLLRDDERDGFAAAVRSETLDADPATDPSVTAALADGVVRLGAAPVAVVPLAVQGTVIGCLVIATLLPQKAGLGLEDRELLDVLAAHAASALLAAKLFHERTRKLRTLEGLMQLLRPAP